jgi:hypothetical protein
MIDMDGPQDTIKVDGSKTETLLMGPIINEKDVLKCARKLAKEAKAKFRANFIRPPLCPLGGGSTVKPYDHDGVPMRLVSSYNLYSCRMEYQLDVIGYPDSAVIE